MMTLNEVAAKAYFFKFYKLVMINIWNKVQGIVKQCFQLTEK